MAVLTQSAENKAAMTTILLTIRMLLVFIPWILQLLLADLALSALLPATAVQPSLTYHLASVIAESIWAGIQHICVDHNDARIILAGDALPHDESAIVVSNHVEWCDFYMIQALAQRSGMLGRCRWFAKQQLKWVPFLGWGLWAMGMPLVSRNWTEDKREMDRVFHGVTVQKWPVCKFRNLLCMTTKIARRASYLYQLLHRAHFFQRGNALHCSQV